MHWYSTAPKPLDVVWCRWPFSDGSGGFKDRPCLVSVVRSNQGRYGIEIAYGTSKLRRTYPGGAFIIAHYASLEAIGLPQATRFDLLVTQTLPWCAEWFPSFPGTPSPIVGHLTEREKLRLRMFSELKKVMFAGIGGVDEE